MTAQDHHFLWEHADAALKIDPTSLEAKHLRGMVALFQRDFKAAEDHFQAVLIQSPSDFAASNNLAVALCFQADESKQRRALEHAQVNVRQYPRQAEAYSTLESRTESLFDAKPNISGLSMSVSLTPESASVSQWTRDDVNRFLRISRIVSAELGIATALEEKLNSVIGSPKYYRANNGDFVQWIWILNGLEVCYSHSSSLDILDVTYAEPSRRSSPVAD